MRTDYEKLWVLTVPMKERFRGITQREIVIIKGERFSEWSPFLEYQDHEAATWLKAALSFANQPLPEIFRTQIPINATLPAVRPENVQGVLQRFGKFESVKLKVAQAGESLSDDLARIQMVHQLYPTAKLRLDANGGYLLDNAKKLADQLGDIPIEYLEQPVATIPELAQLRGWLQGKYLIAADESIRKTLDPEAVVAAGAADILMLKAQPLGGIAAALEITKLGPDVVVSSALESSIGISQGAYLAAAIPDLKYDCGLGTVNLLAEDVTSDSLVPKDGFLEVREIEPDVDLLEKLKASDERTAWWEARLERCLELL